MQRCVRGFAIRGALIAALATGAAWATEREESEPLDPAAAPTESEGARAPLQLAESHEAAGETGEMEAAERPATERSGTAAGAERSERAEGSEATGFRDSREAVEVLATDLGEAEVLVPATIVVTEGEGRALRIRNTGASERTLVIRDLGVEVSLPPGEETEVPLEGLEEGTIHAIGLRGQAGFSSDLATLVVLPARTGSAAPSVSAPPPTGETGASTPPEESRPSEDVPSGAESPSGSEPSGTGAGGERDPAGTP